MNINSRALLWVYKSSIKIREPHTIITTGAQQEPHTEHVCYVLKRPKHARTKPIKGTNISDDTCDAHKGTASAPPTSPWVCAHVNFV